MDTKRPFNVADIMKHIEEHHPGSEIDDKTNFSSRIDWHYERKLDQGNKKKE